MRLTRSNQNNLLAGASLCLMAACMAMGFTSEAAAPIEAQPNAVTAPEDSPQTPKADADGAQKPAVDRSGKRRIGKASFYADRFAGRKMADGNRMDASGENAASRTLPLGTTAKVTNLKTGKSALITIQDRGPYVDGRIIDLSPGTAEKIGLTRREGITKVAVTPIAVPMPDGQIKLGAAIRKEPEYALNVRNRSDRNERADGGG